MNSSILEYLCESGIDRTIVDILERFHCEHVIRLFSKNDQDMLFADTTDGLFRLKISNFHDGEFNLLVVPE